MRKLLRDSSGQSLLEFALLLPLMLLLIVNVVNFGGLFYAYITVTHASRSGATYMMLGKSSAGGPAFPAASTVQSVVLADLVSLPHASFATINVCSNKNGGAYAPETCTPPPDPSTGLMYTDPQPNTSSLGSVEVKYTYCPFIPSWNFPALGIYSTLPSCTVGSTSITGGTVVDRLAVVRLLQ